MRDSTLEDQASCQEFHRKSAIRVLASRYLAWLDMALLTFLLAIAMIATFRHLPQDTLSTFLGRTVSVKDLILIATCICLWRCVLWVVGVYREQGLARLVQRLIIGTAICTIIAAAAFMMHPHSHTMAGAMLLFWALSTGALISSRGAVLFYSRYLGMRTRTEQQILIVGSGKLAQQLYRNLQTHPRWSYNVIGFVDSQPQQHAQKIGKYLGTLHDLSDLLMHNTIEKVFIALPLKSHYEQIQKALTVCERAGVQSQYLTDLFATYVAKHREPDEDSMVLHMVHDDSRRFLKRTLDIVVSFFGLLLLSPVLLILALLVRFSSPGPILFRQERYGLNKRRFTMFKFRSMVANAEERQAQLEHLNETGNHLFKISRDPRITPIGQVLRKTSLDELPQLFNVLMGQMSLVGPRPLPMRDVSRFNELGLMRRFSVKPGITGLWQITDRSNESGDAWIELDLQYIDSWSLRLDLEILTKTFPVVFKGRGAV